MKSINKNHIKRIARKSIKNNIFKNNLTKKKALVKYWADNNIITDTALLRAFESVPREKFVLHSHKELAYEDVPLPILEGQTISQPSTVMLMLQALELKPGQKVLEIGAGSGYLAAMIAVMINPYACNSADNSYNSNSVDNSCNIKKNNSYNIENNEFSKSNAHSNSAICGAAYTNGNYSNGNNGNAGLVIATEIIPELVDFAKKNLKNYFRELKAAGAAVIDDNVDGVKVVLHDGSVGYEAEAPYDRIIVSAACPEFPEVLVKQLKENGILVVPVSISKYSQEVIVCRKIKGSIETRSLGNFVFVPLRGKRGFLE